MTNFKTFKNEMLEALQSEAPHEKKNELINKAVQLFNNKLRVYYNFSISDYEELLEGAKNYSEYEKAINTLQSNRQYMIQTKNSYEDFKEFLQSDMATDGLKTLENLENDKIEITENLFIFDTNELRKEHCI